MLKETAGYNPHCLIEMLLRNVLYHILLPTFALSSTLHLQIPPSTLIPAPSTLPSTSYATLTTSNGTLTAPLRRNNSFLFRNLAPGSYLCDVYTRDYTIAPLRVDVDGGEKIEVWQTFRGNEWDNRGERLGGGVGEVVVDVRVVGRKEYYEVKGGCELSSFCLTVARCCCIGR